MISTFVTPRPVKIEKTEIDAIFDGGEAASGDAVAIAVSVTEAGWFWPSETKFLVVVPGGTVGWVKIKYCKFPDLLR